MRNRKNMKVEAGNQMTEKEKMVTKKLYDANYDETLYKERTEAKNLCYDYNQLRP